LCTVPLAGPFQGRMMLRWTITPPPPVKAASKHFQACGREDDDLGTPMTARSHLVTRVLLCLACRLITGRRIDTCSARMHTQVTHYYTPPAWCTWNRWQVGLQRVGSNCHAYCACAVCICAFHEQEADPTSLSGGWCAPLAEANRPRVVSVATCGEQPVRCFPPPSCSCTPPPTSPLHQRRARGGQNPLSM
jgi:hypothetical protein